MDRQTDSLEKFIVDLCTLVGDLSLEDLDLCVGGSRTLLVQRLQPSDVLQLARVLGAQVLRHDLRFALAHRLLDLFELLFQLWKV